MVEVPKKRDLSLQVGIDVNKEIDDFLSLEAPAQMELSPYLNRALKRNQKYSKS